MKAEFSPWLDCEDGAVHICDPFGRRNSWEKMTLFIFVMSLDFKAKSQTVHFCDTFGKAKFMRKLKISIFDVSLILRQKSDCSLLWSCLKVEIHEKNDIFDCECSLFQGKSQTVHFYDPFWRSKFMRKNDAFDCQFSLLSQGNVRLFTFVILFEGRNSWEKIMSSTVNLAFFFKAKVKSDCSLLWSFLKV